jgi:Arc/MetJ-type ribon-helix-helix transcriptional regulator
MRIITVNLPESYLKAIKKITGENGYFPSRSELIRVAVREWLIEELKAASSFAKFERKQVDLDTLNGSKTHVFVPTENGITKYNLVHR